MKIVRMEKYRAQTMSKLKYSRKKRIWGKRMEICRNSVAMTGARYFEIYSIGMFVTYILTNWKSKLKLSIIFRVWAAAAS